MHFPIISITLLVLTMSGWNFMGGGEQVAAFNLNDLGIKDLGDIFNTINNMEMSVPSFTELFKKLVRKCKKNNVALDLKAVVNSYVCLGQIDNSQSTASDPDSFFDKMCTKWPETQDCVQPIFKQLELCFSSEVLQLDGILLEIAKILKVPLCSEDDIMTTGFFDTVLQDGPLTMSCLMNHTNVIINDAVECFGRTSNTLNATDNNISNIVAAQGICQNFDAYMDCFIKSLDICNNRRVEKLVYHIIETLGFKRIISKYIIKCT